MHIYKTTNLNNNKIYIGLSTKSVDESDGYYGSGILISKAIKKWGKDNFKKEILVTGIEDKDQLRILEIKFIKEFNSTNRDIGYNISPGGDLNPDSQRVAVYKYTIEGELVKHYSTKKDVVKETGDSNIYRKKEVNSRPLKGYWYSEVPLTPEQVKQKQSKYLENRSMVFKEAAKKRMSDPKLAEFYRDNMRKIRTEKRTVD